MAKQDGVQSSGPAGTGDTATTLKERVEEGLDQVRPWLKADGGDVELVEVTEDGIVRVKLSGACGGCPMRDMTLRAGIGRVLKERIPEVKDVESV